MRELESAATELALAASQMEKAINARYLQLAKDLYSQGEPYPYEAAQESLLKDIQQIKSSERFNAIQKRTITKVTDLWKPHISESNSPHKKEAAHV